MGRNKTADQVEHVEHGEHGEHGDVALAPPPQPTRFRVRLKYSPDALVHAAHEGEAWSKYRRHMHIISTVHAPEITPVTEGEVAIEPPPAPPPPPMPAIEIK